MQCLSPVAQAGLDRRADPVVQALAAPAGLARRADPVVQTLVAPVLRAAVAGRVPVAEPVDRAAAVDRVSVVPADQGREGPAADAPR